MRLDDLLKRVRAGYALSEQDVREIKRRLLKGERPQEICKDYDVSLNAIRNIKKGKTYFYIEVAAEEPPDVK